MTLPWTWDAGRRLVVTKLEPHPVTGQWQVECTWNDAPIKPFSLPPECTDDNDRKAAIEFEVTDQIASALELAR